MAAHLFLADTHFSRNRNFEAYDDPRFRQAIALYRRLRALLSDLERAAHDGTRLHVFDDPRSVRLEFRGERYSRSVILDRKLWNVLLLHPKARTMLHVLVEPEESVA